MALWEKKQKQTAQPKEEPIDVESYLHQQEQNSEEVVALLLTLVEGKGVTAINDLKTGKYIVRDKSS